MGKTIRCNKCCGEIKYRSELVVVQEGILGVAAYHERCYGSVSKSIKSFIMSKPLNSPEGIIGLIASNIIFMILLYTSIKGNLYGGIYVLIFILGFYPNFHYFLAWHYYLRHLK